jgi:hypothetical protein
MSVLVRRSAAPLFDGDVGRRRQKINPITDEDLTTINGGVTFLKMAIIVF